MDPELHILVMAVNLHLAKQSSWIGTHTWHDVSTFDFPRLLDLAQRHRLIPFLHSFVRDSGMPVPDEFRNRLDDAFHVHLARNTFMTEALRDLLTDLSGRGMRVLPMRGPILAARLYGDAVYRQCDDLDLLLERNSLLEVKRLLIAQGFRPHLTMTPELERLYINAGWEIILKSPDDRFSIELHTELTPRSYGVRIPMREWWSHVESWEWDGYSTPTFSLPWLYLSNMIHAAKHLWSRLSWLADLHALERMGGTSLLAEVESIAARYGLLKMLRCGHGLTDWVSHEEPADDPTVRMIIQNMATSQLWSSRERLRMQASLRDGCWEPVRYLAAELCEPSYRDWLTCPALHRMPFLYYVWRPLRLVTEIVGGRFHRRSQG